MPESCGELEACSIEPELVETGASRSAERISRVEGFRGSVRFDTPKPDDTPPKLLDTKRLISLGWTALESFSVDFDVTVQ